MVATAAYQTPTAWLTGLGKSPAESADILATYESGASLRVCVYQAPHTFLRFHGQKSSRPIHAPNYWADGSVLGSAFGRASQFEGWLTDAEIVDIAKGHYRELTAICHNWNPLQDDTLWKIELRGSETVQGLEGPAASQPTFAAGAHGVATASRLRGGATQVYLDPGTPFICTPVSWRNI